MSDLKRVVRAEVDWNEGEPDDARCVHGEADVFRLVEVLRYFARLNGVHSADDDQQHVVDERQQEPLVLLGIAVVTSSTAAAVDLPEPLVLHSAF